MPRLTLDYAALGIMLSKQTKLMAEAIKHLNNTMDTNNEPAVKVVRVVEILDKLDRDLERVS